MRAIIENMISPDYVLCYIPRVLEIFGGGKLFRFENFGLFSQKLCTILETTSYNFQITTPGVAYGWYILYIYLHIFDMLYIKTVATF